MHFMYRNCTSTGISMLHYGLIFERSCYQMFRPHEFHPCRIILESLSFVARVSGDSQQSLLISYLQVW